MGQRHSFQSHANKRDLDRDQQLALKPSPNESEVSVTTNRPSPPPKPPRKRHKPNDMGDEATVIRGEDKMSFKTSAAQPEAKPVEPSDKKLYTGELLLEVTATGKVVGSIAGSLADKSAQLLKMPGTKEAWKKAYARLITRHTKANSANELVLVHPRNVLLSEASDIIQSVCQKTENLAALCKIVSDWVDTLPTLSTVEPKERAMVERLEAIKFETKQVVFQPNPSPPSKVRPAIDVFDCHTHADDEQPCKNLVGAYINDTKCQLSQCDGLGPGDKFSVSMDDHEIKVCSDEGAPHETHVFRVERVVLRETPVHPNPTMQECRHGLFYAICGTYKRVQGQDMVVQMETSPFWGYIMTTSVAPSGSPVDRLIGRCN